MFSRRARTVWTAAIAFLAIPVIHAGGGMSMEKPGRNEIISLPKPPETGAVSLEEAIWRRRSVRSYTAEAIPLEAVSALLWAAQGITDEKYGFRSAPSAGATYPLELYMATPEYVAHYMPAGHRLVVTKRSDVRGALAGAAGDQAWIAEAPAVFVFAADRARTAIVYGERAELYVHIEIGCASENLMLQAVALGLGSVAVGAFDEDEVAGILGLPDGWTPYLIVPVGAPAR